MNHPRKIAVAGLALLLAAVAVWARDTRWLASPADTLPLVLGIPLAVILARPWKIAGNPFTPFQRNFAIAGLIAFAAGWLLGSLTTLAISWTVLALLWADWGFTSSPGRNRLGWLLLLSFPWLTIEWQSIGWAFRLSSAFVAEHLFNLLLMPVQRDGTSVLIMGIPIEIEAACAGWNLLQLTFLAGVAFGVYEIRSNRRFGYLLCLLPVVVWIANLLRILILSGIALSFDSQVATGPAHGLTGLVVLCAVLGMTKGICLLLDPPRKVSTRTVRAS